MAAFTATGTFTGVVDLLTQFRVFITGSPSWTENNWSAEGSGQRFHIQKTIGGVARYCNFRAMIDEYLPGTSSSPFLTFYGLLTNSSTAFSAGTSSLSQTGSPPLDGTTPRGGLISPDKVVARAYRFVADTDFFSITIIDQNGRYQHIIQTFTVDTHGVYCSSTFDKLQSYEYDRVVTGSLLLAGTEIESVPFDYWGNHMLYGGSQVRMQSDKPSALVYPAIAPVFQVASNDPECGIVGPTLLANSPNANVGIPVLFPFAVFVRDSATASKQFDGISGIKALNKRYINSGDTIVVGGVTYVVYPANYKVPNNAICFKVS